MGGEQDKVQDEVTKLMPSIVAQHRLKAPRELVYLHRALGGTHQLLKQLRVSAEWRPMLEEYGTACIKEAEAAPK